VVDKLEARTLARLAELGEHIRATRRACGVSRSKLADKIGMHPANYARIERGKKNVTLETLMRIAEGLGVELIVVLAASKPPKSPARLRGNRPMR
jgi:transcriptional regulator with XRE-family HTH domain